MNRHEKIAWYNLAVIAVSVLCFTILFFVLKQSRSLETSFRVASSAFGILGFLGFGQTLFRKEGSDKRIMGFFDPELDERDIQIYRRAGLHAFSTLWVFCVLAILCIWMYFRWTHQLEGSVTIRLDVDWLPLSIFPCFLLIMLVYSISIIHQQRRGSVSDDGPLVPDTRSLIISLFMLPVFILIGLFVFFQGEFLFAHLFVTLGFGVCAMTLREIRRKQPSSENSTTARRIILFGRVINVAFTLLFAGLVVMFLRSLAGAGSDLGFHVAALFILIFIVLIFIRTVIADLKHYLRERRHEKA